MTYTRYVPAPPLNRYIEYLYYLDGQMAFPQERILPLPTLDLKVNLGGPFRVYEGNHPDRAQIYTKSWVVGLFNVYHTIDWPPDMGVYGVHFKPDGAYPFFGLPMSELHNQVVSLDTLWGQFTSEVRERLYAAPTVQAGLILFERLLRVHLYGELQASNVVTYGIAELDRHHGTLPIRELSDQIGISQNHLCTQFKRVVGASAKELARLYRFEHILRSIDPMQSIDWTRITHQYGYYDQSHLNKDFIAFTGCSPSRYVHLRQRVYTEHSRIDQLTLRNLPID